MCGMTATAKTSANEFKWFYDLDVAVIPTNKSCIRKDEVDFIFSNTVAKYEALVLEIKNVHETGRPILVGTASIEESEKLAMALNEVRINCNILNAKNDELEASIIAKAGALGAVTVSTNMAGRGTDIRLGGEREQDKEKVVELGGLYVISTNRHESRRIDNQLRGRSGRQGNPGSSRAFISLDDDLFKRYGNSILIPAKKRYNQQKGPINNTMLAHLFQKAQRVAEGQNEDIRTLLWTYSKIIEDQRKIIYSRYRSILLERHSNSLLAVAAPEEYNTALAYIGAVVLNKVEKCISLFHIGQCWADYINQVNYIREGIHLVNIGGRIPVEEFNRTIVKAYQELVATIDKEIVNTFKSMDFSSGEVDLLKMGIKAPASTWTYQITDNPFSDNIGLLLASERNIVFAAIGFMAMWPLIVSATFYNWIKKVNILSNLICNLREVYLWLQKKFVQGVNLFFRNKRLR